jgi:hypothetical protein
VNTGADRTRARSPAGRLHERLSNDVIHGFPPYAREFQIDGLGASFFT